MRSYLFLVFGFSGPKAKLMLRYPDGKREQISLPERAKLMVRIVDEMYWITVLIKSFEGG